MKRYKIYVCGPQDCPHDPDFEHDNYFGCVPKDFSSTTGRSKRHSQTRVEHASLPLGYKWFWDGGCSARSLAALTGNVDA